MFHNNHEIKIWTITHLKGGFKVKFCFYLENSPLLKKAENQETNKLGTEQSARIFLLDSVMVLKRTVVFGLWGFRGLVKLRNHVVVHFTSGSILLAVNVFIVKLLEFNVVVIQANTPSCKWNPTELFKMVKKTTSFLPQDPHSDLCTCVYKDLSLGCPVTLRNKSLWNWICQTSLVRSKLVSHSAALYNGLSMSFKQAVKLDTGIYPSAVELTVSFSQLLTILQKFIGRVTICLTLAQQPWKLEKTSFLLRGSSTIRSVVFPVREVGLVRIRIWLTFSHGKATCCWVWSNEMDDDLTVGALFTGIFLKVPF